MSAGLALGVCLAAFFFLFAHGYVEKRRNDKNLESIPIRINVNGIRGKSTATRLITAILQEAGYKVVGKTTGTSARMLYWYTEDEKEIKRPKMGVSIKEQIGVISEAASQGAEALVCECMAVRPEYQKVLQNQILKSTLTVIVNVLDDHLEEMGPTKKEIASAFAETIPYNGSLVVPWCEFTPLFMKVARSRNTNVYVTNEAEVSREFLDSFEYTLFANNVAVALATARALGISDEVAFRGMKNAKPDPGALQFVKVKKDAIFVNAFAANEPDSTQKIWNLVKETKFPWQNPIIVMNCRSDRVDRTWQFIKDFFPNIPGCTLIVIGGNTSACRKAYANGHFSNVEEFCCFEGEDVSEAMEYLEGIMEGRVIFGVGNTHGAGEAFIAALMTPSEGEDAPVVVHPTYTELLANTASASQGEAGDDDGSDEAAANLEVLEGEVTEAQEGDGGRMRGNILVAAEAFALRAELDKHVLETRKELSKGYRVDVSVDADNFGDILAIYAVATGQVNDYPWGISFSREEDSDLLRKIYWKMTQIWRRTNVTLSDGWFGNAISVRRINAAAAANLYQFTSKQRKTAVSLSKYSDVVETLVRRSAFAGLTGSQFQETLERLPSGVWGERRSVLLAASSLVGRVGYFPKGRSLSYGFDVRWGETISDYDTEKGASDRPLRYGLDSAGLVEWAFVNAFGPDHKSFAPWQESFAVSLKEAMPGDLAFYRDVVGGRKNHIGIVLTVGEEGPKSVIHCDRNGGVIVSSSEEFGHVRRPLIYSEQQRGKY